MRHNPLRALAATGTPITNAWLSMTGSLGAEAIARLGFDAVTIDLQHGMIDFADLLPMLQAVSLTAAVPLVRVPAHDTSMIMKVLDAGARGVIVPLVNSAADAEQAVAACRYPPRGIRSFGPTRAALAEGPDYHLHANDGVSVFVMIETKRGLDDLEAICAVDGLDGIYVGPSDLSYALGLAPRLDHPDPRHRAAVAHIVEVAKRYDLLVGLHTAETEFARRAAVEGMDMLTIAIDIRCLRDEARRRLEAFRGG
jgi:4-hydroxy-2-oxoheptanedioate aldolase